MASSRLARELRAAREEVEYGIKEFISGLVVGIVIGILIGVQYAR